MKRLLIYGLVLTSLAVLGWWAYLDQRGPSSLAREVGAGKGAPPAAAPSAAPPSPASGGSSAAAGGARGPVSVEAARARKVSLSEEVFAVGTLRANESVMVRPEMSGRVVSLGFSEGTPVRRGEILLALDASILAAQVEQARAETVLSRTTYERTVDLAKRNFVSESARDQAAANLSVQEAKLKLAEAQLARTQIVAPFNGVVGLRNFSIGDFVREGADLMLLEDVARMKVDLRLPERFLGQLRRGQSIEMTVDAFPGRVFRASLDALDVQIDANGRAVVVRGSLDNPDASLRGGMFAKARIVLREKPDAIVVPEEAIQPQGNDLYVFRIVESRAMRAKVSGGQRRDGLVEILEGVQVGDLVVTAGQLRLPRDGLEVRVVDPSKPAARPAAAPAAAPAPAPAPAPARPVG